MTASSRVRARLGLIGFCSLIAFPLAAQPAGSPVAAIYVVQTTGFGAGGMAVLRYQPYVAFENGTAVRGLDVPPEDLDPTQRSDSTRWVRWEMIRDTLLITDADGRERRYGPKRVFKGHPADAGERLEGRWRAIGGAGNAATGGGAAVVAATTMELHADGRFEMIRAGGGSNEASDVRVAGSSRRSAAGSYLLAGHVLELRFDDGTVDRRGFYFLPDRGVKSTKAFGFGGSTFTGGPSRP